VKRVSRFKEPPVGRKVCRGFFIVPARMFGEVERVAGGFRSARLDRTDANRNEAGGQAATWMLSNNLDCRMEVRRRPDLDGRKPPGGVNTLATGSRDRASEVFGCAAGSCGRSVPVFCSDAIKT